MLAPLALLELLLARCALPVPTQFVHLVPLAWQAVHTKRMPAHHPPMLFAQHVLHVWQVVPIRQLLATSLPIQSAVSVLLEAMSALYAALQSTLAA